VNDRPTHEINLIIPHTLAVGGKLVMPHFDDHETLLVVGVQGQRITVTPWHWRDRFYECPPGDDNHGEQRVRLPGEQLDRCRGCGHRLETGGIAPVQTRYLVLRDPRLSWREPQQRMRARTTGL
jgi:hypothetical protein